MGFESILGQTEALSFLQSALSRERIPSAFLFHGPRHVGKRTTALALAMALNCAQHPGGCGECPSCRKIAEALHPDVETVVPDGQYIKIDQVREVQEHISLIPYEARKRVIIISQAERMNLQAANAFLKTLEEPPGNTLIVLCADQPGRLLETIRSRCLPVRFSLLGTAVVRELMAGMGELEGEALEFAAHFAQGRVRREMVEHAPQWLEVRNALLTLLSALHRPIFPQVSELCARWSASEEWPFVLEWLESWFHDLALLGSGAPSSALVNEDRLEALHTAAVRFTPPVAERCYQRVLDTREAIRIWNANKTLALESL
ncbi:MAG: DNA polymerase III subunit delta', partial [Deltaproteobacteria bacterium]|nr:DNA polymerase III subunit delta' [Deltaproteobacteria bacterium]